MRKFLFALLLAATPACGEAVGGGGESTTAAGAGHPLVGSPAPSLSLATVNGKGTFDLGKVKGKVVVVDFWATWCEPCKRSFPKLQEIYAKLGGSGVELVGISEDEENSGLVEFGNSHGAKFPLAWDSGKSVAGRWQPKSMPTTFIVDRNGIVRFAHLGYHDGDETEIEKEVKSLL